MTFPALLRAAEQAAVAIGRLDAALQNHPLRKAWEMRARIDAAVHAAALNGRKVDKERLFAMVAGIPVDPLRDYGSERQALALVVLLGQLQGVSDLPPDLALTAPEAVSHADMAAHLLAEADQVLDHLRAAAAPTPLLAAAEVAWAIRREIDARPAVLHYALPAWLAERGLSTQPIPGLCAFPPRMGERDWQEAFLQKLHQTAGEGRQRLLALTMAWEDWKQRIGPRRKDSRIYEVLLMALASPALSPGMVARWLAPRRPRQTAARDDYEKLSRQRKSSPLTPAEEKRFRMLAARFSAPYALAGGILQELADLGILRESTARQTWKIYTVADIGLAPMAAKGSVVPAVPHASQIPSDLANGDAIDALLDGLAAATARTTATLARLGFGLNDIRKEMGEDDPEP